MHEPSSGAWTGPSVFAGFSTGRPLRNTPTRTICLREPGAGWRATRWNPPASFRTVYTSRDPETALAEALAHFRHYGLPVHKAMPRVIVAIDSKLTRLLNLTDGVTRRAIGVAEKRLMTEPWRDFQKRGREALTQAIGRIAYESDLEGLIVPSSAKKGGTNLILFPANLDGPNSWLRIINKDALPSGA